PVARGAAPRRCRSDVLSRDRSLSGARRPAVTVDKWEGRQLCEDGACTGVIGQDGTCKMCGKPAPNFGDFRKPGRVSSKSDADEVEEESSEPVASPTKVAAKADKVAAWNERKLCSDGACVGLI